MKRLYFVDSVKPYDTEGHFIARLLDQEHNPWGNRSLYLTVSGEAVHTDLVNSYKSELPPNIKGTEGGLHDGMFIEADEDYTTTHTIDKSRNLMLRTQKDYTVCHTIQTEDLSYIKQGVSNNLTITKTKKKCNVSLFCFNVGQGDMAVFISSENHVYIIDTYITANLANQRVSDLKSVLGDREIDALIITHRHLDHYCGAYRLFDNFKVNNLVVNASFTDPKQPIQVKNLFQKARNNHAQIICPFPNEFFIDGCTTFKVSVLSKSTVNENSNSIVIEALYNNKMYLLTGDADAKDLEKICPQNADEIVLKVSHHGSKTGTSPAFLSKFCGWKKKEAFISVGARNRYHHPNALCGFWLNGQNFNVEASPKISTPYKKY